MTSDLAPDAEREMAELELEESRILRELQQMDEAAASKSVDRQKRAAQKIPSEVSPLVVALNQLLAECEEEVRRAKGYIAKQKPTLRIARCKRGEDVPDHATYLSRPKGTGVDFSVPVRIKEYNDTVKHPIFLNTIRDKCLANKYNNTEEYIGDMRLMWDNTAAFNTVAELDWVVQHAKLLFECAQDAVSHRAKRFNKVMLALGRPKGRDRKRKRTSNEPNGTVVSSLMVGSSIQVYYEDARKWRDGVIREMIDGQFRIEYEDESNAFEWLDLAHEAKWRLPTARSRRIETVNKRRKGAAKTRFGPARVDAVKEVEKEVENGADKEEVNEMKEELLAYVEDSKVAILNTIQSRYAAIEVKVNQSDALRRVLLAIGNLQETFTSKLDAMQKTVDKLRGKVEELKKEKRSEKEGDNGERDDEQTVAAPNGERDDEQTVAAPNGKQCEESD